MTSRRKLLIALGVCALTAPFGSIAQQQGKVWRVGFLAGVSRPPSLADHRLGGFVRGMRELGYVEGKNLIIEWRFADGRDELLPGLAAELVRLKVDVIVTGSSQATGAAHVGAQVATGAQAGAQAGAAQVGAALQHAAAGAAQLGAALQLLQLL